jgi:uncharacterized protein (TIGR03437 family)
MSNLWTLRGLLDIPRPALVPLLLSAAISFTPATAAEFSGMVADARHPYGALVGIVGASVSYGATTTATDKDGRFSLEIPAQDADPFLDITAAGYAPYRERLSRMVAGAFHLIPEDLYRSVYLLVWQRTSNNPNNWHRKWEQQPEFVIVRSGASGEQLQTLTAMLLAGDEYRLLTGGRYRTARLAFVDSKPSGSARYGKTVISFARGVGGGIAHSEDANGVINYAEITFDVNEPVNRTYLWHEMVHTVTAGGHINEWPSVVSEVAGNGVVSKMDQETLNCIYNSPPRREMPAVQPTGPQQPVVSHGGVLNNASYLPPGAPHSGIAQGSVFAVFGRNLGASGVSKVHAFPLPTEMAGTSIQVSVGDATVDAYILYASPNQVGALLPSSTPAGDGTLRVRFAGQTSPAVPILVVPRAFGIFTLNQAGTGPAVAQVFQTPENQPVNSMTQAAAPTQVVTLWGTGLGPVEGSEAAGAVPGRIDAGVEVWVAGQAAKVIYAGRSGCCAGIDQVTIELPQGSTGCYVPVVVRAGGVLSNFATLSVAARGRLCSDPLGFSDAVIERLTQYRPLKTATVRLETRTGPELPITLPPSSERASAIFKLNNHPAVLAAQGPLGTVVSRGNCLAFACAKGDCLGQDPAEAGLQDAGTALDLSGPAGVARVLEKTPGVYGVNLAGLGDPSFVKPGVYTVSGSGGKRVGAFTASLTIPATSARWASEEEPGEIDRTRALTVNWIPGVSGQAVMGVMGQSVPSGSGSSMAFLCMEDASARRLTVPSLVLESLPPGTGTLSLIEIVPGPVEAFVADGVDAGYFYLQRIDSRSARFK